MVKFFDRLIEVNFMKKWLLSKDLKRINQKDIQGMNIPCKGLWLACLITIRRSEWLKQSEKKYGIK